MSDLGSHRNDLAFYALDIRTPLTVEAIADRPAHPDLAPATMKVIYEYGARGDMPPVTLTWYQGEVKPKSGPTAVSRSGPMRSCSSATKA